jgi:hypothetical protein
MMSRFSSFRLSFRSVGRSFLPSPGWNAFTYAGVDICGESVGWITSRAPIGYNFYICLPHRRKSAYPGEFVRCIALTLQGLVEECQERRIWIEGKLAQRPRHCKELRLCS